MKALKQRLAEIYAKARGVRWDVFAGRVATGLGVVGGLSQYAGWIPGRTGAVVAVVCVVCAGLSPRITKAAGLLKAANDQQTPLLKILPQLISTLLAGPSIIAQAKTAEADEAQKQKDAQNEQRIAQQVKDELAKLGITQSLGQTERSQDVPADLQGALNKALPASQTNGGAQDQENAASQEVVDQQPAVLSATVAVEDKASV